MDVRLHQLLVRTRQTTEVISFGCVTFLHGPVGTGKSTVARLVDYCLGGDIEKTPAIQQEFVAAELTVELGDHACVIERAFTDTQVVRVTWESADGAQSLNVPLNAQQQPIFGESVYNLSDLLFELCGVTPIKVRKNSRDPDAPLVRLSFRDVWTYCYLDQTHLDSSFFRLEDAFRGRKSQDAMRFFTGLFSERLSQLDALLAKTVEEQRVKRESVSQIRMFMSRFDLGSELEMSAQLQDAQRNLNEARIRKRELERSRTSDTHPSDQLREQLRHLGAEVSRFEQAVAEARGALDEQRALRAELITAKTKAHRAQQAGKVLEGVEYQRCPQCGIDVSERPKSDDHCRLCGSMTAAVNTPSLDAEALRRDLNERIDQIADAMSRRQQEISRMERFLARSRQTKLTVDRELQDSLARYDSAFVESIRAVEGEIGTWVERIRSLEKLRQMPVAITDLEREAGALQGKIDNLQWSIQEERTRLKNADENVASIAEAFKKVMLEVGFPGVAPSDDIILDPRSWAPSVKHGEQQWGFWDTGSGGKKTLFNVCYALALHTVAIERNFPLPRLLIIDSPTKNISDEENPELVRALYSSVYRLASKQGNQTIQFLLIDSDLVAPSYGLIGFYERRMSGESGSPSLIPYYSGP